MLWKANIDLQYVGESSLAIAQYVTGYATKAEKSNMQDLWQEVSSHSSIYSRLWSRSLRSRQVGLYEASSLLLGDHLCEKSTTIKWIDVSPSHKRKRRLKNHSALVEIRERDAQSTDIFDNIIDNFYPERPDDIEEVCLYDFVAEYEKCGKDDDGNPVYRKRSKPILPNHRIYNPSKENEQENYYYTLLLLFVPFRDEADLIEEGETAESAFERHLEENDELNTHSEKLQRMLKARERVQQINEARRAREEDVTNEPGPVEDDDGPQVAGEATSAMNDVLDLHQNDESDGPSLEELVQSLNTDQARVYDQVKSHFEHQLTHEKKQCSCADFKPLQMFVSGVGGTGKSFLIKTVRALVTKMWE